MSQPTVQVLYFTSEVPQSVIEVLAAFQAANGRAMTFTEFQTQLFYMIGYGTLPSDCYELRTEYANDSEYPQTIGNPSSVTPPIPVPPPSGPSLLAHAISVPATGYAASQTTSAINTVGANFVIIAANSENFTGNDTTITDSENNDWTLISPATQGGALLYYCANPKTSSTHTFTNTSGSGYYSGIAVQAWGGMSASPLVAYDDSGGSSPAFATALTPSVGNVIVVAYGVSGGTTTLGDATLAPVGFSFSDEVSGTELAISMAYAIFDGTPETTVATWDDVTTFAAGQVVYYEGAYYLAGYTGSNHIPSNLGGWWTVFSGTPCQPVCTGGGYLCTAIAALAAA